MTLRKILMLDDNPISESIDKIRHKLKREGIAVDIHLLNPQDQKFKTQNSEGNFEIDFEKIKEEINQHHRQVKYDVVACDFNFSSETLNGYQLIRWLINESNSSNFLFKKAKFVCYSSEINRFQSHIIDNDELIRLIKLNIHSIFTRNDMPNEIPALIKKINQSFSMSDHLMCRLEEMPDLKFKNVFPPYKDKTLGYISQDINKDSPQAKKFQKLFVDLTYAHILDLNEQ
ncbi:hypothetical protein [Acinetobacter baumannii]|uniref:hypothetical protein n=1 Tax=Acinetobacter baumannii TaxID=470 RepID=UPI000810E823|nr:hypothetical protein [Acinetobacter baumannii]